MVKRGSSFNTSAWAYPLSKKEQVIGPWCHANMTFLQVPIPWRGAPEGMKKVFFSELLLIASAHAPQTISTKNI